MDTIDLPLYPSDSTTTLETALQDLRHRGRSGVVLEKGDEYRLVYTGDLLMARAAGVTQLQQITVGEPVLLLDNVDGQNFHVDLVRPKKTPDEYIELFTSYDRAYALAGAVAQSAMVVTSSEEFAQALMVTGGYQCDGTPTHYFPAPRVSAGDVCPRVPECTRADGTAPKVHPAP